MWLLNGAPCWCYNGYSCQSYKYSPPPPKNTFITISSFYFFYKTFFGQQCQRSGRTLTSSSQGRGFESNNRQCRSYREIILSGSHSLGLILSFMMPMSSFFQFLFLSLFPISYLFLSLYSLFPLSLSSSFPNISTLFLYPHYLSLSSFPLSSLSTLYPCLSLLFPPLSPFSISSVSPSPLQPLSLFLYVFFL